MMPNKKVVLGLHPTSRGFGWILFEDVRLPLDWGTVDIRRDKNAIALSRIKSMLDKHQPTILAMERHDAEGARRSQRIRQLYLAVVRYTNGVTLDFSRPGKPTDNAFIEAFNGRFRAECLNAHWFMSLEDAREKLEDSGRPRISRSER
jgi:transposase InsO family protein